MNLYDIDANIALLIDPETGEISDFEAFENLNLARESKIDFLCKDIKEAGVIADALQSEINRLQEKKRMVTNRAEKHKAFLSGYLGGSNYKSPMFTCYYSTAKSLTGDTNAFKEWAVNEGKNEFLNFKEPELKATVIKKAIADGMNMPYLSLSENKVLCIR